MAENSTNGAAAQPDAAPKTPQVKMQVLGQFIRDLSFENIVVQRGNVSNVTPEISVQVNLDAKKGNKDGQYQVLTKFKVTSVDKESKDVLFALELDYGGIFAIDGIPEEQLHPFLMIECPRMLFPFVRRIVSDVTRDGGFTPLNLDNVDFVSIYRNEIQRRAQTQAAVAPESPDVPEKTN